MKYLKIKDNVDLSQLELLGFYFDGESYIYNIDNDRFILINNENKNLDIHYLVFAEELKIKNKYSEVSIISKIPEIILTLYIAGFLETYEED